MLDIWNISKNADSFSTPQHLRVDGSYKILELHGTEVTSDNVQKVTEELTKKIQDNQPDLVLFAGDIVKEPKDRTGMKELLDVLFSPLVQARIPFATTFGDMDESKTFPREQQLELYQTYAGCLTIHGPKTIDGVGNYVIPLLDGQNQLTSVIWCMDTRGHVEEYEKQYHSPHRARLASPIYSQHYLDGVRFNQTMWYWHLSQRLEEMYGHKIPGAMFFHTPTGEHAIVPMNASLTQMTGYQGEDVATQTVQSGIVSAVMERGDVGGIWCGHVRKDNIDFSGIYADIRLGLTPNFARERCFGRIRVIIFSDGSFTERF